MLVGNLAKTQRLGQRQGVSKPALVCLRRNDPDVVGERASDTLQHGQPFGVDTVVVCQQNPHVFLPLFILLRQNTPRTVIPALSRDPVDACLRHGNSPFQPNDLGWMDAGSSPACRHL